MKGDNHMTLARVLGYIIVLFYVLAATNGLKRYTKNTIVRNIAKKHVLFGQLAVGTAIVHFIVNISNGNTNILGFITLLLLIATGALGYLFKTKKIKKLYIAHRIVGPITVVAIILHIFV
jgi:hypothetical protein